MRALTSLLLLLSLCFTAPQARAESVAVEAIASLADPAKLATLYNLACYECQLGELEVAKVRLSYACKLDKTYRVLALDDEDLKPLWDSFIEL